MIINTKHYTDEQIDQIRHEGFIYSCACPSQVSENIANLRELFKYQKQCLTDANTALDEKTHRLIAEATQRAQDIMEQCLHEVLIHEQWDLDTLTMPEGLRKKLELTI